MTNSATLAGALILLGLPFGAQEPDRILTGVERTEHFTIHFRTGSRAGAAVDRIAAMAEKEFVRITTALEVKPEGGLELFLYDEVGELATITRTSGNEGFSAGTQGHLPYDNDQTRFHEMVHLVAARLPKSGSESRNLFFAEGLANALLEFVHGVHVHAVAAFELKRKSLPPLADMTAAPDFYAWMVQHPGLNAYDVAASYFRLLIDTHGIEKVKKYYTGTTPKEAFGLEESELEVAWRKHLEAYKLRPEVEVLLARRRGEDAKFAVFKLDPDQRLPAELLGKPADWKSLSNAPIQGDKSKWKRTGESVRGSSDTSDWNFCLLAAAKFGNAAVRAKIKPAEGCVGIQLQLGPKCQAMLTNAGAFVWNGGGVASEPAERITGRHEFDFILERREKVVTIWIDGVKVLQGKASDESGPVSVGVAGGVAAFENVRVRELK
ncbi:MAG TPA: hypothetical protein VK661_03095 [Planctomycetota bacterium]|nr:hypothetical protein [Planctomycetota bacterium]